MCVRSVGFSILYILDVHTFMYNLPSYRVWKFSIILWRILHQELGRHLEMHGEGVLILFRSMSMYRLGISYSLCIVIFMIYGVVVCLKKLSVYNFLLLICANLLKFYSYILSKKSWKIGLWPIIDYASGSLCICISELHYY